MGSRQGGFQKFLRDDSMSIALFSLFLLCVAGQAVTGWYAYNGALRRVHVREIAFGTYLGTGNFLDGAFSNWQAAILQLAVLIAFGTVLHQKGAVHSRKMNVRTLEWKLGRRKTWRAWLYANSLSLAFIALFAATFVLHAVFGSWKYNEDQALLHRPALPLGAYVRSSAFWFSNFQCWEAEFLAIGLYIVFSIFLRQERSPESKPVGARDRQTGGANE